MKKPVTKQWCGDEYFSITVAKKQQILDQFGKSGESAWQLPWMCYTLSIDWEMKEIFCYLFLKLAKLRIRIKKINYLLLNPMNFFYFHNYTIVSVI
jgi:hypothetical protein